jgi:hypothetical protein
MKHLIILLSFSTLLTSCSTCYECSEDVIIYNGNTPTDTMSQSEEFCTSDQTEVEAREDAGAICKVN